MSHNINTLVFGQAKNRTVIKKFVHRLKLPEHQLKWWKMYYAAVNLSVVAKLEFWKPTLTQKRLEASEWCGATVEYSALAGSRQYRLLETPAHWEKPRTFAHHQAKESDIPGPRAVQWALLALPAHYDGKKLQKTTSWKKKKVLVESESVKELFRLAQNRKHCAELTSNLL